MSNFKIIYTVLKTLEKAMELEEYDGEIISAENLNIPYPLWCRLMKMLVDNGYVTGVTVWQTFECQYPKVKVTRPEITMQGLEYLNDNSLMKKASNIAKGISEIIP